MKNTNLVLSHKIFIYNIMADKFGDTLTLGDPHETRALVEETLGFEHDAYSDATTGNITAQIDPRDPFYLEKDGKLDGLVCRFSRYEAEDDNKDWYRIASVRPGESLFDGSADLVELTLTKILSRDEAEEGS